MGTLSFFADLFCWSFIMVAQASDFPIDRLKGQFVYQDHFEVANVRRAETVLSETAQGQARIRELRAQGYTCIRKNPQTRICSKNWHPEKSPEGLAGAVQKFMKGIQIEFEGGLIPPRLILDGSTSQVWEVSERVRIRDAELSFYRVIRNRDGTVFVAFPVNEEQPLNPLKYRSPQQLILTVIGNFKDTESSTTAYTIDAFLEP